jgi:DNA-binding NarL/FixJ family response regulator
MIEKKKNHNNEDKAKILVVDDHAIVRKGLSLLINQETNLTVSAEAEDADQALELLDEKQIDLAIVDISLNGTDGLQLTKKIKTKYPYLPILILTMHDEAHYAELAFQAGAEGYMTKHEATGAIISAINLMLAGKNYLSDSMAQKISENNT